MHRLETRLLRWLDTLFAVTLTGALVMAAVTAWPGRAQAADTWQVSLPGPVVTACNGTPGR